MNDFYTCINVNKDKCYMFKTTHEWEGLIPFPIFLIKIFYSHNMLLFNFHANYYCQLSNQNIYTYSYTWWMLLLGF